MESWRNIWIGLCLFIILHPQYEKLEHSGVKGYTFIMPISSLRFHHPPYTKKPLPPLCCICFYPDPGSAIIFFNLPSLLYMHSQILNKQNLCISVSFPSMIYEWQVPWCSLMVWEGDIILNIKVKTICNYDKRGLLTLKFKTGAR